MAHRTTSDLIDVARLIDQLGTASFERTFFEFVAQRARIAVLFAFEFRGGAEGRLLITEGEDSDITARARRLSQDYARGDYTLDEALLKYQRMEPETFELFVQKAEDKNPEFRHKYFDDVDSVQEVSVFERRTDPAVLYIGLSSTIAGFDTSEISRVRSLAPLMVSLVRRHTALVDASGADMSRIRERRLDTLRRILLEHEAGLTSREAEVCASIVIGYRAEAIADRLGISPNTVATHRKRAYAKLHISSQTELFAIFFAGWSS
jgi:DNA-binding CsgD family transcriptional regulator